MSDEHPVDRYIRTKAVCDEKSKKAKELVKRLSDTASKLEINWTQIQFSGTLQDGRTLKTTTTHPHLIADLNAPSIEMIYSAIEDWKKAKSEMEAAIEPLTREQKQALRLPAD